MIPTLTEADLEQPRTQSELRKCVDDLHRRFSETNEGKRAVRLRRGHLVKKFMEEIWPLALFADAFYRDRSDVRFRPVIGDQPLYDALLIEAGCPQQFLEITQAFDGHQNHLRMRHLVQHRHAPVTGPNLVQDKLTGSMPETWSDTESHEHLLARTFATIQEAVHRKSQKPYGSQTSLIVEFDDNHIHTESDQRILNDFVRSTLLVRSGTRFAALYLVSDRERLAFKYEFRAAK